MKRSAVAGLAFAAAILLAGQPSAAADESCPAKNGPNDLKLVAGSPQTAKVGTAFDSSLQVALANRNGCPLTVTLSGVSVTFSAPSSGASGTFAASGSNEVTVGTDADGAAAAPTFTANRTEGQYDVRAQSRYGSVTFDLTNTASGVAAALAASGPTEQSATVNRQYAQALQAKVTDAHGAPLAGVAVTFSVGTGPSGASATFLTGTAQATAPSDVSGQATSPVLVANSMPGAFTATASVDGISALTTYSLRNNAAVYTLAAGGAPSQAATVNGRYPEPLQVQVLDETGQPAEGATVTFALATGPSGASATFVGGGEARATATTDASGRANSPAFVANGTSGRFTATATLAGASTPVTYPLRNLAGTLVTRPLSLKATVNRRYPQRLRARLLGARREPLDGITVTFTLSKAESGAGASFPDDANQATATTNAAGWASSPLLVANRVAGRFMAAATAGSAGSKPLTYTLQNVAGEPAKIVAGVASGQSTRAGTRFPIRLAVTVTDKDANPVTGATITFTAPAHGPGGYFRIASRGRPSSARASRAARVETNADGIAIAPLFTANRTPGGYIVSATLAGWRLRAAFALVNRVPSL